MDGLGAGSTSPGVAAGGREGIPEESGALMYGSWMTGCGQGVINCPNPGGNIGHAWFL